MKSIGQCNYLSNWDSCLELMTNRMIKVINNQSQMKIESKFCRKLDSQYPRRIWTTLTKRWKESKKRTRQSSKKKG